MSKNPKSLLLVEIQFLSLIFIFLTGPVIAKNFYLILELISIVIGLWAVLVMQKLSKLRITPDIAGNAKFIKEGPYKFIRHPMYLSVLLLSLALILNYFSIVRLFLFLILFIDLTIKISYEEALLEKHFKDYGLYKRRTKKLLPFIY